MLGVPFVRANVGDRYVLEKMVEHNWTLGGENSGHIIIADKNTTGDGIIASLAVLSAMVQHRLSLNELASAVKLFPQVLINVRFAGGDNPLESEAVKAVAADVEFYCVSLVLSLLFASWSNVKTVYLQNNVQKKLQKQ